MKFGEYNCECGANVCGDPDRHEPKCPKCGKMGSWTKVVENDLMCAVSDPTPDPFDDALIDPDEPIPQREDENLAGNFQIALATMARYNLMREEMGLEPLTIDDFMEDTL